MLAGGIEASIILRRDDERERLHHERITAIVSHSECETVAHRVCTVVAVQQGAGGQIGLGFNRE
jgi:hypothetical protein